MLSRASCPHGMGSSVAAEELSPRKECVTNHFNKNVMKKILMMCAWAMLLGGCANDAGEFPGNPVPIPPKEVSPELLQKIDDLNAGLVALKELSAAFARTDVRSLDEVAGGVRIGLGDGEELTIACDTEAGVPLIGIAAEGETFYWTLAAADGQPWLEDASGERMPLNGPVPVAGVDDAGYWTVTTEAGTTPWRIADAAGNPVEADVSCGTAQFRSVAASEGRVRVALADGGELSTVLVRDLSAHGTANCYTVSAPGRYLFRATVRGNGADDEAQVFAPQIDPADGMTADWLWTDAEGLLSEIAYDRSAGEIRFTAGAGKGNTLIALLKDGTVVWSWHIWVTDPPQEMTYANGSVFQDRNLGATGTAPGSTEAYGLYYQWGRKDPFYGGEKTETSATAFAQAKEHTRINPAREDLAWAFSKTATTPEEAAAHPMTFYNNTVGTTSDWLASPKKLLWGDKKSLHDPCPPGYRVPSIDAWADLSSGRNYIEGISAWDGTNFGMIYTYNGQTAWYPAQGYRNYSSGSIVGLHSSTGGSGAYWSADVTAAKSCYLFFRSQLSSSGSINPELDKERSYGYTVRCCKE